MDPIRSAAHDAPMWTLEEHARLILLDHCAAPGRLAPAGIYQVLVARGWFREETPMKGVLRFRLTRLGRRELVHWRRAKAAWTAPGCDG